MSTPPMSNTMQSGAWPGWQPIETAPDCDVIIECEDGSIFLAHNHCYVEGLHAPVKVWCAAREGIHPKCWTEGACWDANDDGEPSTKPIRWLPLPPAPEVGK